MKFNLVCNFGCTRQISLVYEVSLRDILLVHFVRSVHNPSAVRSTTRRVFFFIYLLIGPRRGSLRERHLLQTKCRQVSTRTYPVRR